MRLDALARTLLAILLGNMLSSVQPQAAAQTPQQANTQQGMQATANYSKLPLTFEANQGQTGAKVKFLSRGKGYTAFLTAGGIALSLRPNQPVPVQQTGNIVASNQSHPLNTTLQFKLMGAAQNASVIGESRAAWRRELFHWQRSDEMADQGADLCPGPLQERVPGNRSRLLRKPSAIGI